MREEEDEKKEEGEECINSGEEKEQEKLRRRRTARMNKKGGKKTTNANTMKRWQERAHGYVGPRAGILIRDTLNGSTYRRYQCSLNMCHPATYQLG